MENFQTAHGWHLGPVLRCTGQPRLFGPVPSRVCSSVSLFCTSACTSPRICPHEMWKKAIYCSAKHVRISSGAGSVFCFSDTSLPMQITSDVYQTTLQTATHKCLKQHVPTNRHVFQCGMLCKFPTPQARPTNLGTPFVCRSTSALPNSFEVPCTVTHRHAWYKQSGTNAKNGNLLFPVANEGRREQI